jgi:hypothetical protein
VYEVTPAYNQPDWEEKGKMFFPLPAGAMSDSLLLCKDDYIIIEPSLVTETGAKSVLELYDGHPERWTQDAYGMVTKDGKNTDRREQACKVCLGVALGLVYYEPGTQAFDILNAANERLFRVLHAPAVAKYGFEDAYRNHTSNRWIIDWNDKVGRTHEEVVQVCRNARI